MDRETAITVDIRGNDLSCQNTEAQGAQKIGHVTELDAIVLDAASHSAFRPKCMSCPVVQLCKGTTPYRAREWHGDGRQCQWRQ